MIPLHFKIVSPSNLLHCPLYRKGQSLLYKHNCNGHNQKHPQHAVSFSSLVSCRTTTATTATTTRRRRRRDITAADAAAAIDAVTNIPCKNMAVASFKDSRRFLCNKKKNILAVSSLSLGKNSSRSSHCCFRKRESFLMTPFPPLPPRRRCDSSRHDGLGSGSGSIRTKTTTSTATTVPTKKANATTTTNSDNTDATHGKINERSSSSSSSRSHNSNNHNHHGGLYLYDSLSQTSKVIPVSIPRHHQDSDKQNSATDRSRKGIAWYTCGPTVYDSAHLGHARTYVSLDILQRCLRQIHKMQYLASSTHSWLGPSTVASSAPASPTPAPIFIMNITNVDDKILARSKERNIPALELAEYYEREFWKDMDALNVMRPCIVTRVTDHVECSIIPYIQRIMDQGMAYRIDHDGVYFDVGKFEDTTMEMYGGKRNRYGKLAVSSGRMETLFSWGNNAMTNHEERKSPKKDPRDFVLWKNRGGNDGSSSASDGKDNDYEQQDMLWDSPWGKGRPGWHIECSAMIESTMQLDFMRDHYKLHVHAGGIDLKFPHHTNEIAQAEAYHSRRSKSRTRVRDGKENDNCYNQDGDWEEGEEWIPHWIHTGHLHIDGLKMSKSLKNFITIRELLEEGRNDSSSDGDDGGGGGVGASFNRLHSPADDFRLWCLGLSGSYRGPATYSKSRLMEARVVREKIVRFLVDGEQWIKGMESSCSSLSKFTAREFDLMQQTNKCQMTCLQLIFGMERNLDSHHQSEQFDFDGSAYLNALIELSDAGNKYIAANIMTRGESSTVAVVQALTVLRECLSIVGFSDKTVRAGKSDYVGNDSHEQQHNQNSTGVVQELVSFRKAVRELALEQVKRCGQSENASDMPNNVDIGKDLLTLCDKLRDEDLPKVGIEIFDSVGQDILSDWRFIIPRDEMNGDDNKDSTDSSKQLSRGPEIITESNFFKVGRYEGQFSAFDANDFPTLDANGMELSKRMAKKLLKKKTSYFEKKKK